MSKFYVEKPDGEGYIYTYTGRKAMPYPVFQAEIIERGRMDVDYLDWGKLDMVAPAWMVEKQNDEGFAPRGGRIDSTDVWEVEGPIRELTPREYMQIAMQHWTTADCWYSPMLELFEELQAKQEGNTNV